MLNCRDAWINIFLNGSPCACPLWIPLLWGRTLSLESTYIRARLVEGPGLEADYLVFGDLVPSLLPMHHFFPNRCPVSLCLFLASFLKLLCECSFRVRKDLYFNQLHFHICRRWKCPRCMLLTWAEESRWDVRAEKMMVEFQVLTTMQWAVDRTWYVRRWWPTPHPAQSLLHPAAYLIARGGFQEVHAHPHLSLRSLPTM